jgi:small subunit ribosomal protein S17
VSNDKIVERQHTDISCCDGSEIKKSSLKKTREGTVVSNRMDKTIVVSSIVPVKHKKYGKFVRITKKFYAHDEHNQCLVGDRVKIVETRPLSKTKRWRVVEVKVTAGDSSLDGIQTVA